ncbi:MAG: hypothetical protein EPO00_01115, partial [Chloroflexota bacterium]
MAQCFDKTKDIVIREAIEQLHEPEHRIVGDFAEQPKGAFELPRLQARNQPYGAVEQPNEDQEGCEPLRKVDEIL